MPGPAGVPGGPGEKGSRGDPGVQGERGKQVKQHQYILKLVLGPFMLSQNEAVDVPSKYFFFWFNFFFVFKGWSEYNNNIN